MKKNIGREYATPTIEEINIAAEQVFAQSGLGGAHNDYNNPWNNFVQEGQDQDGYVEF